MGTSCRKRFLWQMEDKQLTSIKVAINRRNLVNPIKSSAPLNRLFDPERHSLIVHLHKKDASSGSNNELRSIFDRDGVVCNKEVTPDRSLDRDRQRQTHSLQHSLRPHSLDTDSNKRCIDTSTHSQESSDSSQVGSPRIFRENFNSKCCGEHSAKHNRKNQTTNEVENRPSISGYRCADGNRSHFRRSRSITPQSTGSALVSGNSKNKLKLAQTEDDVHRQQRRDEQSQSPRPQSSRSRHRPPSAATRSSRSGRLSTESIDSHHHFRHDRWTRQDKSILHGQSTRRSRSSDGNRNKSKQKQDDIYDLQRHQDSTTQLPRRPLSFRTSRSRSTESTVSSRHHYRHNRSGRTQSSSRRNKTILYGWSTRRNRSRSRSLTPLRPGEYRPGKRKRVAGAADGIQREERGIAAAAVSIPSFIPIDGGSVAFGPRGPPPPRGYHPRMPQPMLAGPYIQYVPVITHHHPQQQQLLPPSFHSMLYHPPVGGLTAPALRPPKVYNHRPIPHGNNKSAAAAAAANTTPQPESTTTRATTPADDATSTSTSNVTVEPREHHLYTDKFMDCADNVPNMAAKQL